MDSGYRPEHDNALQHAIADPWLDEPLGEAYAEGSDQLAPVTLVSPWLIHQLTATPTLVDGHPAVEIYMSIVRDYDRAADVCPHEGYDILGWHNAVALAVRADRSGRWASFFPSVGAFQPLPHSDGAMLDLQHQELAAAWRFIPDELGSFDLWAFVSVNGAYMPFDEMMVSAHYIDSNGAARLRVLL